MTRRIGLLVVLLGSLLGCRTASPDHATLIESDPSPDGCTSEQQCERGQICLAGSCGSCAEASQCASEICHPSGRCEPLPCALDDECPTRQICDGGQCVHTPSPSEQLDAACGIAAIYFAPDSAKLPDNQQQQLQAAAPCLLELLADDGELLLEAHADGQGGEQYSLQLAQRRGSSVHELLAKLGLPRERMRVVGKGASETQGTDEPSRARDRRVQIVHDTP